MEGGKVGADTKGFGTEHFSPLKLSSKPEAGRGIMRGSQERDAQKMRWKRRCVV
jgi:hypothetical protein